MRQFIDRMVPLLLSIALLSACGARGLSPNTASPTDDALVDAHVSQEVNLEDAPVALSGVGSSSPETISTSYAVSKPSGGTSTLALAEASGVLEKKSSKAVIDYSNIEDGYVMARFTAATEKRLKAQVKGPTTVYTYNLTQGQWTTFPLSDGNGDYQIIIYENVVDSKYSSVLSLSCSVTLSDEFAPFLRPNQYVDYAPAVNTIAKAEELAGGETDTLKKVEHIYNYVVDNISYDWDKAATVQSGYLPVLDTILASNIGICFDYAALMTGMLRSQGVPCKLVVGYAGTAYHAWISVWTEESGWMDSAIFFDGVSWQRMDPTFASSGKEDASIIAYIGDGNNYSVKFLY